MASDYTVIYIHPTAPQQPVPGAPCNGCGVCCLVEPCPLGVLLSRQRKGACKALQWQVSQGVYLCGAVINPQQVLRDALPVRWVAIARLLAPVLPGLALRWIAAGKGCDATLQSQPADSKTMQLPMSSTPPTHHHDG